MFRYVPLGLVLAFITLNPSSVRGSVILFTDQAAFSAAAELGGLQENDELWVGTWSTTLHAPELLPGFTNAGFNNQTLRQIVHISMGGQRVRLRLSTFGASALVVDAAHIALSAGGSSIVVGSDAGRTCG